MLGVDDFFCERISHSLNEKEEKKDGIEETKETEKNPFS